MKNKLGRSITALLLSGTMLVGSQGIVTAFADHGDNSDASELLSVQTIGDSDPSEVVVGESGTVSSTIDFIDTAVELIDHTVEVIPATDGTTITKVKITMLETLDPANDTVLKELIDKEEAHKQDENQPALTQEEAAKLEETRKVFENAKAKYLSDAFIDAHTAARGAYDALSNEEQVQVINYSLLADMEANIAYVMQAVNALPAAKQPKVNYPAETSTVDYSKQQSELVTYDRYEYDKENKVYIFYYTIHEGAGSNIVVDLSKRALEMWDNETQMPGDHFKFKILLNNESGNTYYYKDNSFVLAPGDTGNFGNTEDGSMLPVLTYDGQLLPIQFAGAMIPEYFYQDIFGVEGSGNVTFEMMCQIYDYLANKGYTADTAISDYMLDYYNEKRNVNYESLTDLFADHPDWLDGRLVTNNGIWKMSESELQTYIEQYPWIDPFVVFKNGNVQIKWPEPEIAAVSYNSFYCGLFSAVYGKENVDILNPNGNGVEFSRAHGVGDYLSGTDLYQETNQYFSDLTKDGFNTGDILEIWSGYGIDGPGMGNSFANYEFTYYNMIELEQPTPPVDPTDPPIDPPVDPDPEEPGNPRPGGGGDDDDDTPTIINDTPVPMADEPTVTIDDEDVPLADLPEDGLVTIDDGEVPLKDNPETGSSFPFVALAAAALSLCGISVLKPKKK